MYIKMIYSIIFTIGHKMKVSNGKDNKQINRFTIFIEDGHRFTASLAAVRPNGLAKILASTHISAVYPCENQFLIIISSTKITDNTQKEIKQDLLESAGDQLQT